MPNASIGTMGVPISRNRAPRRNGVGVGTTPVCSATRPSRRRSESGSGPLWYEYLQVSQSRSSSALESGQTPDDVFDMTTYMSPVDLR